MRFTLDLGSLPTVRIRPRLAGLLYLLAVVGLWLGQGSMTDLLVEDSVSATAANVLKHGTEWKAMFAFNLLSACFMAAALPLLHEILRPVNARLSKLAVTYAVVGCAIQAFLNVFLYGALVLINGTPYRDAFRPVEFQAIAHLCMTIFNSGIFVALVFFGLFATIAGCLAFTSTFLPRALGAVVGLGGFGWVLILFPNQVDPIWEFVLAGGILGQLSLGLWLLVKGVNKERWNLMANGGAHDEPTDEPPDVPPGIEVPAVEAVTLESKNIINRPKLVR
jgi:hypothetical protein